MQPPTDPNHIDVSYSLPEVAELLIKHHNLHEGLYELSLQFQIAVGGVGIGKSPENILPGAMIGVSAIGLSRSEKKGPNTVDAAKVNPLKKKSKKNPPLEK